MSFGDISNEFLWMDILNIYYFDLLVQNGLFRFTFQKYPDEVDDCKQVSNIH